MPSCCGRWARCRRTERVTTEEPGVSGVSGRQPACPKLSGAGNVAATMNAPLRNPIKFDVQGLVSAVEQNDSTDVFSPHLTPAQWDILGSYLQPFGVTGGQVLIQQGAEDRTLYLVETGGL